MRVYYSENVDDLTPLDIAVMLNYSEVAQLLLKHGAVRNEKCKLVFRGAVFLITR